MSVALSAKRHTSECAATVLRLDGKIGAREYLATGCVHHVANVIPTQRERSALRLGFERCDAAPGCAAANTYHARRARVTTRHRSIGFEILVEGGVQLIGGKRSRPAETRRDVAEEAVRPADAIADALEVSRARGTPDVGWFGRRSAARRVKW